MPQVLYRVLLSLTLFPLMMSFLIAWFGQMSPCILCYLDRLWLFALFFILWKMKQRGKQIAAFFAVMGLALCTNMYHLYLIYVAPANSKCIPWALMHMKTTVLSQISFLLRYIEGHLSSCQTHDMIWFGLGLPLWLLALHSVMIAVFVFYVRCSKDV